NAVRSTVAPHPGARDRALPVAQRRLRRKQSFEAHAFDDSEPRTECNTFDIARDKFHQLPSGFHFPAPSPAGFQLSAEREVQRGTEPARAVPWRLSDL